MSSAVPGVSTLPLTSRHRPDAELTRGAAADACTGTGADHVGAVASIMASSAITHAAAAAGRRGLWAAGLRGETDEGCILFPEYVGEGEESAVPGRTEPFEDRHRHRHGRGIRALRGG